MICLKNQFIEIQTSIQECENRVCGFHFDNWSLTIKCGCDCFLKCFSFKNTSK